MFLKYNFMAYKKETGMVYDVYPDFFDIKFQEYFDKIKPLVNEFLNRLPKFASILDLGSGSGIYSDYFKSSGFNPVCLDISRAMILRAKNKGLSAIIGDFENLPFPSETFEGIFACASLLHLPKYSFSGALSGICKVLTPNGLLFLEMKEGLYETMVPFPKQPNLSRWFSCYSHDELLGYFERDFSVEILPKTKISGKNYLNYILTKK